MGNGGKCPENPAEFGRDKTMWFEHDDGRHGDPWVAKKESDPSPTSGRAVALFFASVRGR